MTFTKASKEEATHWIPTDLGDTVDLNFFTIDKAYEVHKNKHNEICVSDNLGNKDNMTYMWATVKGDFVKITE
jgi:hypothetical protein